MAGEVGSTRRRVFVEDTRRDGQFLRVTWHGDQQQFVVSNWQDTVCVGATRVPVAAAPELVSVLVDGLADAARCPVAATPVPVTLREHLRAWWHERGRQATVLALPQSDRHRHRRSA